MIVRRQNGFGSKWALPAKLASGPSVLMAHPPLNSATGDPFWRKGPAPDWNTSVRVSRHDPRLHALSRGLGDPARKKTVEPAADDRPVHDVVGELRGPTLSAALRQELGIPGAPPAHHGVRDFWMELDPDRRP